MIGVLCFPIVPNISANLDHSIEYERLLSAMLLKHLTHKYIKAHYIDAYIHIHT